MVKLFYPQVSFDIDSTYNKSFKKFKIWVNQEEKRLISLEKTEERAKQSAEQAQRTKEEFKN